MPEFGKVVHGGRLRVFSFGPPVMASLGPVELVFSGVYLEKARAAEPISVAPFVKVPARLDTLPNGVLVLRRVDTESVKVEELREIKGPEHPSFGQLDPLRLHVEFETDLAAADRATVTVPIPAPPSPCRYFELMVELQRDGAALAPAENNGRLDISLELLRPLPFTVEEENGDPIAGAKATIQYPCGFELEFIADDKGRIGANGLPPGECSVALSRPQ